MRALTANIQKSSEGETYHLQIWDGLLGRSLLYDGSYPCGRITFHDEPSPKLHLMTLYIPKDRSFTLTNNDPMTPVIKDVIRSLSKDCVRIEDHIEYLFIRYEYFVHVPATIHNHNKISPDVWSQRPCPNGTSYRIPHSDIQSFQDFMKNGSRIDIRTAFFIEPGVEL